MGDHYDDDILCEIFLMLSKANYICITFGDCVENRRKCKT